jgi:hypothetical protein
MPLFEVKSLMTQRRYRKPANASAGSVRRTTTALRYVLLVHPGTA